MGLFFSRGYDREKKVVITATKGKWSPVDLAFLCGPYAVLDPVTKQKTEEVKYNDKMTISLNEDQARWVAAQLMNIVGGKMPDIAPADDEPVPF
jgi:hypothetical protein